MLFMIIIKAVIALYANYNYHYMNCMGSLGVSVDGPDPRTRTPTEAT